MKKADPPADPSNAIRMSASDVSAVIGMAWQDDTPFEAMALQFGLSEEQVIALMREHLKAKSFRVWRMRVRGRVSKHQALQRARSHATSEETVRTLALLELDRRPSQSESEPLALPRSGVTAASLR
jgi:uncharacterized protein (TIGR03643 family)